MDYRPRPVALPLDRYPQLPRLQQERGDESPPGRIELEVLRREALRIHLYEILPGLHPLPEIWVRQEKEPSFESDLLGRNKPSRRDRGTKTRSLPSGAAG